MLNNVVSPIDHVVMNYQNQTRTNGICGHVLGNMAFGSILSRPTWIADFEPSVRRGFGMLNDDLTGTLTLLEARECCFAGADLPAVGSASRGFSAEGADQSGAPLVDKAPALDGDGSYGTSRRPPMVSTVPWVASAPKVRCVWWPRPHQRSTATCRRAGRVKGAVRRRDKRHCV
jgi:hypothetical protein